MTLILGIEDPANNRAILAADSGAWRNDQVDVLRTPKIWRNGDWLLGLSGRWAASLKARQVPMPTRDEVADDSFDAAEIALMGWAERVHEAFAAMEDRAERTGGKRDNNSLIVVRGQWVWYVCDGCVTNVERGYQAIGAEDYALGAMAALTPPVTHGISLRTMLELAENTMLAVERITTAIHRPFRWMATDGTEGVFE